MSEVLDARVPAVAVRADAPAPQHYIGLVTRTIAFVLDAALIDAVAALVGLAIALVASLLPVSHAHDSVLVAVGVVAFFLWAGAYFVIFWSTTGQTPGSRLMQIRVTRTDGGGLGTTRALIRVGFLVAALVPLGAGLLPILVTRRRRGLQDLVGGSVVVSAPRAK